MADILKHKDCKKKPGGGTTLQDIRRWVERNEKKRFQLDYRYREAGDSVPTSETTYIRAVQGHSMAHISDDAMLHRIQRFEELPPISVHGTYMISWLQIEQSGHVSTMGRKHIHFTSKTPEMGGAVTSGMRTDCEVFVFVDVARAMAAGIVFYRAENGVLLTSGRGGKLSLDFCEKVVERKSGEEISKPQLRRQYKALTPQLETNSRFRTPPRSHDGRASG